MALGTQSASTGTGSVSACLRSRRAPPAGSPPPARRGAAEIVLRFAALTPARRVGADSRRHVPGGRKRSSCFAAPRTHWEERAAASSLRPISTCGVRAACAGVGDPAGRARLELTLSRTFSNGALRRGHAPVGTPTATSRPHEGGASSVRHEALQLLEPVLHDDKTRGSSTRIGRHDVISASGTADRLARRCTSSSVVRWNIWTGMCPNTPSARWPSTLHRVRPRYA